MEHRLDESEVLELPFEDALGAFLLDPEVIVEEAAERAGSRAGEIVHRLRTESGGIGVTVEIALSLEPIVALDDEAVEMPMRWRAARHERLFPRFDGRLRLSALSGTHERTEVALVGSYTPPLGFVGDIADMLGGHAVAQAAARSLLGHVCRRIRRLASAAEPVTV